MTVAALYRYPVKSLGGQLCSSLSPAVRGFVDDRRWMFVDASGRFISQRSNVQLSTFAAEVSQDELRFTRVSDGAVVGAVAGARQGVERAEVVVWDDQFTATVIDSPHLYDITRTLGIPDARLVYMDAPDVRPVDPRYAAPADEVSFADGFPYLITNTASLDDLRQRLGYDTLDVLRFRPNIVVDTPTPWAEDDWKTLRIGNHAFTTPKPCARCIMITHEPGTEERDLRVLGELARFRKVENKVLFGMNGLWRGGQGTVRVGDKVELA